MAFHSITTSNNADESMTEAELEEIQKLHTVVRRSSETLAKNGKMLEEILASVQALNESVKRLETSWYPDLATSTLTVPESSELISAKMDQDIIREPSVTAQLLSLQVEDPPMMKVEDDSSLIDDHKNLDVCSDLEVSSYFASNQHIIYKGQMSQTKVPDSHFSFITFQDEEEFNIVEGSLKSAFGVPSNALDSVFKFSTKGVCQAEVTDAILPLLVFESDGEQSDVDDGCKELDSVASFYTPLKKPPDITHGIILYQNLQQFCVKDLVIKVSKTAQFSEVESRFMLATSFDVLVSASDLCISAVCRTASKIFLGSVISYIILTNHGVFDDSFLLDWLAKPPPFPPDNFRIHTFSAGFGSIVESRFLEFWYCYEISSCRVTFVVEPLIFCSSWYGVELSCDILNFITTAITNPLSYSLLGHFTGLGYYLCQLSHVEFELILTATIHFKTVIDDFENRYDYLIFNGNGWDITDSSNWSNGKHILLILSWVGKPHPIPRDIFQSLTMRLMVSSRGGNEARYFLAHNYILCNLICKYILFDETIAHPGHGHGFEKLSRLYLEDGSNQRSSNVQLILPCGIPLNLKVFDTYQKCSIWNWDMSWSLSYFVANILLVYLGQTSPIRTERCCLIGGDIVSLVLCVLRSKFIKLPWFNKIYRVLLGNSFFSDMSNISLEDFSSYTEPSNAKTKQRIVIHLAWQTSLVHKRGYQTAENCLMVDLVPASRFKFVFLIFSVPRPPD